MTATVGETFPLGPGTLKIGATASLVDVSCLINNAVIAASKDQGDSVTKLCGTVVPGSVSYTYTLAGNVDTDIADAAGLFVLSQTAPGTQQDYEFVPNSDAGTMAAGQLIIDPLDFGGDTTGDTMTSDFEFALVGQPTYTYGVAVAAESAAAEDQEPALA
jgi:hypothetical protein